MTIGGKERQKMRKKRRHLKWIIPVLAVLLLAGGFLIYTADIYHAQPEAISAMESDGSVSVSQTDYGWLFDGPSKDSALIFYPGAKVEARAYACFLHRLASEGMDVCLVQMPFHLALFGMNKADQVMEEHSYDSWYIGGHSLGGAAAAMYASEHGDKLSGIVLLAAYPTSPWRRILSRSAYMAAKIRS